MHKASLGFVLAFVVIFIGYACGSGHPTVKIGTPVAIPPQVVVGRTPVIGYILVCRDENGLETLHTSLAHANDFGEWPPPERCDQ